MATPVITHRKVSGKAAGSDPTRIYGTHWDDTHVITGLENVPNVDTTNASNLTSGTIPAARMPALTGDITTSAGAVATTLATVNTNVGSFGSATQASQVTINGKGLVTAAANVTVTPAIGSITGLGTGVATALAVNVGTAGAPVVNGGALGTPTSGIGTNLTGIPTTALTGTLQAAQEPAHTGDVTNSAGSLALAIDPSLFRGYLSGLTLSTAGSSATFGISAGVAVDSTNAGFMKLASAYTKTTSAWAVGTGNGALDTGAIANTTWYHVFLIKRTDTGVVDVLISLSATAPTMPANYTLSRRIGSMKTNGSAQWNKFIQTGDEFLWDVSVLDVNAGAPTTTNTVYTLGSIPTGITALAFLRLVFTNTASAGTSALVSSTLTGTQIANTPTGNSNLFSTAANAYQDTEARIWTNTSAQVNVSGSAAANNQLFINSFGWADRRGRDT